MIPDSSDSDDEQMQAFLLDKNPDGSHDNGTIYIIVKSDILKTGGLYALEVVADDTIAAVKAKLEAEVKAKLQAEGVDKVVDLEDKRVIFAGKPVNPDRKVRDYKLRTGSVLHLVDELVGGGI